MSGTISTATVPKSWRQRLRNCLVFLGVFVAFGLCWYLYQRITVQPRQLRDQTLARIQADARVIQALGFPIHEDEYFAIGGGGFKHTVETRFEISGPRGRATVEGTALYSRIGQWDFETLRLITHPSEEETDLLKPPTTRFQPTPD